MKFKNAVIYREDFTFRSGGFTIKNGVFDSFEEAEDGIDLEGALVIPGLIDIHFHGNSGEDFSVTDFDGLTKIAYFQARHGITSFAPASMALPEEILKKAYQNAVEFRNKQPEGTSRILGINMEGPYLSQEKKGAQAEKYLMIPDFAMFERLNRAAGGMIKIVCVAPELPGAMEFISRAGDVCTVSIGHTAADYECAKKAIEAGVSHVTHLFNAMSPSLQREPGVIGAAAEEKQVMGELICDGVHIHESIVRAVFSMFTADRIVLVSDSLSCLGMPDGVYESGGQKIYLKNGTPVLEDGVTLAGSATDLFQCMRNAISFGIKPEDAVKAATYNPAKAIGADKTVGSISIGKSADFLICDKALNLKNCYIAGKRIIFM